MTPHSHRVIAMWSGPRSLSTALMYAFAQRRDTDVRDEPFYAAYLAATGIAHPMRAEILQTQPHDPARVAADCLCVTPDEAGQVTVSYQKHHVQHMVAGFPLNWLRAVQNVFLLRHPARIIASYTAKRESPTLADLGLLETGALFDRVTAMGQTPLVIAAEDIRAAPEPMLRALCTALGLDWDPSMLHWPAGPKAYDGIWAPHWYGAVHQSTGFGPPEGAVPEIGADQQALLQAALPTWERLHALRLRADAPAPAG